MHTMTECPHAKALYLAMSEWWSLLQVSRLREFGDEWVLGMVNL